MLILSSYGFESPVITDKLLKTFSLDEKILSKLMNDEY